jgi:membrane protein implicated in regulation of membrane protease activity
VRESHTRQVILLASLIALAGILFILVGGLEEVELLPGKPLPNLFSLLLRPSAGSSSQPGDEIETVGFIASALLLACLVLSVVGVIISPRFRRRLVNLAILAIVLFLALSAYQARERQLGAQSQGPAEEVGGGPSLPGESPPGPEVPPVKASTWMVALAAIGGAAAAVAVGMFVAVKVYPVLLGRRARRGTLEELAERAGEAADAIRSGTDPRDAVLRCYKEMCAILSREGQVHNLSALTPREFSALLRTRGMRDEHVDRLTAIFEEVRYGARDGVPFAGEATACLEAIRSAYAAVGSA